MVTRTKDLYISLYTFTYYIKDIHHYKVAGQCIVHFPHTVYIVICWLAWTFRVRDKVTFVSCLENHPDRWFQHNEKLWSFWTCFFSHTHMISRNMKLFDFGQARSQNKRWMNTDNHWVTQDLYYSICFGPLGVDEHISLLIQPHNS